MIGKIQHSVELIGAFLNKRIKAPPPRPAPCGFPLPVGAGSRWIGLDKEKNIYIIVVR